MGLLTRVMQRLRISSSSSQVDLHNNEELINSLQYNPVLNTLIVSKIFSYTDSRSELLRNRLVCKTWNRIATSKLRSLPIHRVVTQECELKRLLELTNRSADFPVDRIYIKIPRLQKPTTWFYKALSIPTITSLKIVIDSKHFESSIRTINCHMKSLKHLSVSRIPEQSFEAMCVSTCTQKLDHTGHLPSLVSLSLRNANPCKNFLATFDNSVIGLIRSAENLESLHFSHWNSLNRLFREIGPVTKLRNLRINGGKLTETDILVLTAKKGLRLELFVARVDKSVRREVVDEFLRLRVGDAE